MASTLTDEALVARKDPRPRRRPLPSPPPPPLPAAMPPPPHAPDGGGTPAWPHLTALGLGPEALVARRDTIGGSDANVILSSSDERIYRLWQEKRGEVEPEDLSGKLAVMLGCWTEAFNRQWFETMVGHA